MSLPTLITHYDRKIDGEEIYAYCLIDAGDRDFIEEWEWRWINKHGGKWRYGGYTVHPSHYFTIATINALHSDISEGISITRQTITEIA